MVHLGNLYFHLLQNTENLNHLSDQSLEMHRTTFSVSSSILIALSLATLSIAVPFPASKRSLQQRDAVVAINSLHQFGSGSSSSSGSSSTGTEGLNNRCSSNYMTLAGVKRYGAGWKISFRPTIRARLFARSSSAWNTMWSDLQKCVSFPPLSSSQRQSVFKQMVCHAIWGISPVQGGRTWDFESTRSDISMSAAVGRFPFSPPSHRCNW